MKDTRRIIFESIMKKYVSLFEALHTDTHFEFEADGAYFDVDFEKMHTHRNTYRIDFDDRPPKVARSSMHAVNEVFNKVGNLIIDFVRNNECDIAIPFPTEDKTRGLVYNRLVKKLNNTLNGKISVFTDDTYTYFIISVPRNQPKHAIH